MRIDVRRFAVFVGLIPVGCAHQSQALDPPRTSDVALSTPAPASPPAAPVAPVAASQPVAPAVSAPPGRATPLAPAAATAATPILMGLGQSEAAGAQPEGAPFAGQFLEGQTLEQPLNLMAGKCYTIVAAGMGLQQVDLQLVAQPAPMFPPTVMAVSQPGGGPVATIGGKQAGCFKNPLPIGGPARIVVKATRGSGMAAAQVYVK